MADDMPSVPSPDEGGDNGNRGRRRKTRREIRDEYRREHAEKEERRREARAAARKGSGEDGRMTGDDVLAWMHAAPERSRERKRKVAELGARGRETMARHAVGEVILIIVAIALFGAAVWIVVSTSSDVNDVRVTTALYEARAKAMRIKSGDVGTDIVKAASGSDGVASAYKAAVDAANTVSDEQNGLTQGSAGCARTNSCTADQLASFDSTRVSLARVFGQGTDGLQVSDIYNSADGIKGDPRYVWLWAECLPPDSGYDASLSQCPSDFTWTSTVGVVNGSTSSDTSSVRKSLLDTSTPVDTALDGVVKSVTPRYTAVWRCTRTDGTVLGWASATYSPTDGTFTDFRLHYTAAGSALTGLSAQTDAHRTMMGGTTGDVDGSDSVNLDDVTGSGTDSTTTGGTGQ